MNYPYDSSSYKSNYYEYLVSKKNDGSTVTKKIIIILFAAIVALIGSIYICRYVPPIAPFFWILIGFIVWYLWRFVSIEYEYTLADGELDMDAIYGKRQRKKIMSARIRDMELIAPAEPRYLEQSKRNEPSKTICCASALSGPNVYFLIYRDKKTNQKIMMYFEATKKAISILRYYNPSVTIVSDTLTL